MDSQSRGFTLLELMVVLVIAGVLLGIGVPAMGNFLRNSRMTAAANDMTAGFYLARTEAIKRRQPVVICASANPTAAAADCVTGGGAQDRLNATNGWIVFVDDNANGLREVGEQVLQQHDPLPAGITAIASVSPLRLIYQATGYGGSFTDIDGDGKRDPADEDLNGDDLLDVGEDADGDGHLDVAEPFLPSTAFTLIACDARGNVPSAGELSAARAIQVSVTGRPSVSRDKDEIEALGGCP